MARVNCGVPPKYISDQHLIAESVEITMITGGLKKHGFKIKSEIPPKFSMGTGHINFFKNKIKYLNCRLKEVNKELQSRGVDAKTYIDESEYPQHLINDWIPTFEDSSIIRNRIAERLITPLKARKNFHRYKKQIIENIEEFAQNLLESELFYV
jgi:hypothetical protein